MSAPSPDLDASAYYDTLRPEVLALVPTQINRALDVGCGHGALGRAIKARQNAEVHGVELAEHSAAIASSHLDRVWNGPIEEVLAQIPDEHYDCIICADVLEHLNDPWEILNRLTAKLVSSGVLVVSVPNIGHWSIIENLQNGLWRYRQDGILDITHLRFFTRQSMRELLWTAGFKPVITTAKLLPPKANTKNRSRILKQNPESAAYQLLACAEKVRTNKTRSVLVVVLNWNGEFDTLECLASLTKVTYPKHEIVVVDNASSDTSAERVSQDYPDVHLIRNNTNLGYAGGNNVGISFGLKKNFDYILLLNNDTTVSPEFLEPLVEAMEAAPEAAASQPKLYYHHEPDLFWCTGSTFDETNLEFVFENHKIRDDRHSFERVVPVQVCVGAALMLRTSVIRKIGALDENLFLMHEESDWCFRARKHGHICLFVPRSHVWHKVSASLGVASPLMVYFESRNLLRWGQRHLGALDRARLLSHTITRTFNLPSLKAIFSSRAGDPLVSLKHIYWNLANAIRSIRVSWRYPEYIARRIALRDYLLGRCGDCPLQIRELQMKPIKHTEPHA